MPIGGPANRYLVAAAVPGLIHAAASLYWGLGGGWLLETVGTGAVEMHRDSPGLAAAVLLPVALLKLAGVAVPLLNDAGKLPRPRLWRGLSWAGGLFLLLYGAVNTLVSLLALAGAFGALDDAVGVRGHALLWDPLFAVWGALLLLGLRAGRPSGVQVMV